MPAPGSTDAQAPGPSSLDHAAVQGVLNTADLVVCGRMPWSSNLTLLCELRSTDVPEARDPDSGDSRDLSDLGGEPQGALLGRAVYKPAQGERPLWDFPDGLYRREVAAYRLARAVGWDLVPPTVERDGPFGPGSLQWFVEADFDEHYFTLLDDESTHPQLRRMCAFDLLANSTDRKGGHVLVDADRHIWGIDNGLCLHAEFKLRTVIWDFADEALPSDLADDIARFVERPLPDDLVELLDPFERDALRTRVNALLAEGHFPTDPTGRRHPWPLV